MRVELPWSAHCRYAHETIFHYNKMLAVASEDNFSLFYRGQLASRFYWHEIIDVVLLPASSKYVVSLVLSNGESLDLVFSRRSWLGLHSPDVAVDAGNDLRIIKHQIECVV